MTPASISVVVPVLNGGSVWRRCAYALSRQTGCEFQVLVIDSGSTDGSTELPAKFDFQFLQIHKRDFDHGGTRQRAANLLRDSEVIVYLTQDAVLDQPTSLVSIISAFSDEQVGMAYGRQLPRQDADPIEAHARMFNYPAESKTKTLNDVPSLGMKVAFTSNSFAAYRTESLFEVGGFPERLILSEDMVVAARMIKAGWAVAYVADACAVHSHAYTPVQEFKRYFDIGVLHRDQSWILDTFGKPEGEGARFIWSEQRYLLCKAPWLIPAALVRTLAKYLGYKLGQNYVSLPNRIRRSFSMHARYWDVAR